MCLDSCHVYPMLTRQLFMLDTSVWNTQSSHQPRERADGARWLRGRQKQRCHSRLLWASKVRKQWNSYMVSLNRLYILPDTQSSCCVFLFLGISHRRTVDVPGRVVFLQQFYPDIRAGDFTFGVWFLDNKECVGPFDGGIAMVEWNTVGWIQQVGVWECQCK